MPAAKKPAAPSKTSKARKKPVARRADFGAPVDDFFAGQPEPQKSILAALRKLVEAALPDAVASIKWGMPFYSRTDGTMLVGLSSHKSHVNLILSGTADLFADPDGRLEGDGKTGRRLVLRKLTDLPAGSVRKWLAALARK
jgi:hypothetical protein